MSAAPPPARKYAFDTEFAPDGTILRDPLSGERKLLTAEEAEAERAKAYQSGLQDAVARAERDGADAAAHLAAHARDILAKLDEETRRLRNEAALAALAAAKKIAGAALSAFGEARAAAAAEAAMEALPSGPRLIVRVAPALVDGVRKRLDAAAAEHAYAGAILIRSEETLAAGDVIVDWTDGIIALDRKEIEARVEELIDTALNAPAGEG